ncbi:MAG TPA: fructosamine kinase [Alphaproteobacteria bacterium]|nr:fructosamine kinase [Alphaproteobacteria bacterium]
MQVEKNPLSAKVTQIVERATRRLVVSAVTLAGGRTDAKLVVLSDGSQVVVKLPKGNGDKLAIEGSSIEYLKKHTSLPMPEVFYSDDSVLVHEYIVADGTLAADSEPETAELLAKLHEQTASQYGFDFDTLYRGAIQPNKKNGKWTDFFAQNRLLFMARQALDTGYLTSETMGRIEKLAGQLHRWLDEPERPSLIHGDIWSSSVLCRHGRVKAFVDPAICFADSEFEFAFCGVQGLSKRFYAVYNEIRPFRASFFEVRQMIYNLYPLLSDIRLNSADAHRRIDAILKRFGV